MIFMRKALLIIDVQKEFVQDSSYIEQVKTFVKDNPYCAIIGTYFKNYEDSNFVKKLDWHECMSSDASLIKCDKLIEKKGYGLSNYDLEFLKQFSDVLVFGMDSDACVLAICYQLFDANINFHILTKYCRSSGGQEMHQRAIEIMKRNFGSAVIEE